MCAGVGDEPEAWERKKESAAEGQTQVMRAHERGKLQRREHAEGAQ